MTVPSDHDFTVLSPDEAEDAYAGSDVPGEWHSLTAPLGCEQIAASFVRVPPHSDFDQGTGHYHEETEELYLVTAGTLTMRLGEEVRQVSAPGIVRVGPSTPRATYRNESDYPAEAWAISRKAGGHDAVKIDDFWEASAQAAQSR